MEIKINKSNLFEDMNVLLNSKYNIIFGENASGKTSLLRNVIHSYSKQGFDEISSRYTVYIPINRIPLSNRKIVAPIKAMITPLDCLNVQLSKISNSVDEYYFSLRNFVLEDIENISVIEKFMCSIFRNDFVLSNQEYDILSDGYKSMITILCELLYYRKISMANKKDCLFLIDEIDLFIHLSAQSRLYEALSIEFPNIIFILTTHSPVLLRSFRNTDIYEIDEGSIILQPKTYLEDYDTLITSFFDVEKYPGPITKTIELIGRIVSDKNYIDILSIDEKTDLLVNLQLIKSDSKNVYELYQTHIEFCLRIIGNV